MSTSTANRLDEAPIVSVKDLVRHRLDDADRWQLQLVQRDVVWDQVRVRQLLDSLLRGYPIGSILLCRVLEGSVTKGGHDVDSDAPLILDGQQRINALYSAFTEHGTYGSFLLRVTKPLQAPQPRTSRTNKDRSLGHLLHLNAPEDQVDDRGHYIDLSLWQQWESRNENVEAADISAEWLDTHGTEIDPHLDLTGESLVIATDWVRRLLALWREPRMPVLEATIKSAMDVLEVFTRVNLEGVRVTGTDVYFAGVKTFWRDAEQQLGRLQEKIGSPFLKNRLDAVRFLSRVAGLGIGQGDLLPLSIDRLAGDRGEVLRTALTELAAEDSTLLKRVRLFTEWYIQNSELGYVLHQVEAGLFDDVLGWVAACSNSGTDWYEESKPLIDSYLLGATLFRYRSVLGDPFRRIALAEALLAGSRDEPFPLLEIIRVTKGKTQLGGLRGRTVKGLESPLDRDDIANANGWLLIALVQKLPARHEPDEDFDWDHIFPRSLAVRMWAPGDGNRRRHHKHRHLINSVGNFWALNYSLNRSIKDAVGEDKFDQLNDWAVTPGKKFETLKKSLGSAINDKERSDFIKVSKLLKEDDPTKVDSGMEIFKDLVERRTRRLLDEVLTSFPEVKLFAKDNREVGRYDTGDRPLDFAETLGITRPHAHLAGLGLKQARTLLKDRAQLLSAAIEPELVDSFGIVMNRWTGLNRRTGTNNLTTWVAYELVGGNCVELITKWTPFAGASLSFKAYERRGKSGNLYAEFDHIHIGVDWESPDHAIASAFVESVRHVEARHPRIAH